MHVATHAVTPHGSARPQKMLEDTNTYCNKLHELRRRPILQLV